MKTIRLALASGLMAFLWLCPPVFAEVVAKDRVTAQGSVDGQVTSFSPPKGKKLKDFKVEEVSGDVKRLILHRSSQCNGPYGLLYDARPAMGDLLTGLPDAAPIYIKVFGTGTLYLLPEYK